MGKVREGLAKQKKKKWEASQGWFESWFNSSPWLTTLLSGLIGPPVLLILILTFGPYFINRLVLFMKQRLGTIQLMAQRAQYKRLNITETYETSVYNP